MGVPEKLAERMSMAEQHEYLRARFSRRNLMRGGAVTIGAVTGGAFAHLLGLKAALGAAVGLVAVVASASNAPIAAILMGVELFGADSTLYVAGACVAAYLIIGHRSVYPEQQIAYSKSSWIFARADLPVGQEKVRLSYGLLRWWRMRRKRAKSDTDDRS